MLATTVYTLVSQNRVLPKYRNALVLSSMVTFIAGYHYIRIFDSFHKSSMVEGSVGKVVTAGHPDAFRLTFKWSKCHHSGINFNTGHTFFVGVKKTLVRQEQCS